MSTQETSKTLPFHEAKRFLKEGDVLLFRGRGLVSSLIKRASHGLYSHVGVASKVGENGGTIWECVEFREWHGGRSINLEQYAKTNTIDVFRAASSIKVIKPIDAVYDRPYETEISFSGKHVTNIMRKMTGLPYGWKRILWMSTYHIFGLRMFSSIESMVDDFTRDIVYPVCSTAVSYAFYRMGYDLMHHRSDNAMEPSDIARSPLLFHLFTISS
jgi:hypothetical protein